VREGTAGPAEGRKLIARIRLTDPRGNPICARVHPPYLTWTAVDAAG
jgi:Family of unknown function (DUF5990)